MFLYDTTNVLFQCRVLLPHVFFSFFFCMFINKSKIYSLIISLLHITCVFFFVKSKSAERCSGDGGVYMLATQKTVIQQLCSQMVSVMYALGFSHAGTSEEWGASQSWTEQRGPCVGEWAVQRRRLQAKTESNSPHFIHFFLQAPSKQSSSVQKKGLQ